MFGGRLPGCALDSVPGQALAAVEMWEEGGLTDQTRLPARLVTGGVGLCLHNLERAQWGPAPRAGTQILRKERTSSGAGFYFLHFQNPVVSVHRRRPHLLLHQDADPLQHPLAGVLIGNVGLDLKQSHMKTADGDELSFCEDTGKPGTIIKIHNPKMLKINSLNVCP